MKIEIFSRKRLFLRPVWYFRIRHGNSQILAQSQGYSRRIDAKETATNLRVNLANAEIHDA